MAPTLRPDPDAIDRKIRSPQPQHEPTTPDAAGLEIASPTARVYTALAKSLRERTPDRGTRSFSATPALEPGGDLGGNDVVVGVALGTGVEGASLLSDSQDQSGPPGEPSVVLYVTEPIPTATARALAAQAYGVEEITSDEIPVRIARTGPIDLLAHRFRMRPAPGGISVGHEDVTAGTLGALCRGRSGTRADRMLALSNNHVLAAMNDGAAGDPIYQPGVMDGGSPADNRIGYLERYVEIDTSGGPNEVDCATAWVDEDDVRAEQIFLRSGAPAFFRTSNRIAAARVNQLVGKSGRTTQLTAGRIAAVGATVRVNVGRGRMAVFVDQIEVVGLRGDFSQGGDSGSLIWTWDETRDPIGLLFAGGGGSTFANPIDRVLDALDVELIA